MKNYRTKTIFALCVIVMMLLAVGCTNDLDQELPDNSPGTVQDLPGAGEAGTNGTATDGTTTDGVIIDDTTTDGTVVDGTATDGTVVDGTVTDETATDGYPVTDEGTTDGGVVAPVDGSGEAPPPAEGGEAAPADGSGETAPAEGGEAAPADGSGEAAPAEGGEAAPADGSGGAAPAEGGEAAPVDSGTGVGAITHVIQPGQTVSTIAQQYGVTVEDIVAANNLVNVNSIVAGQSLQIVAGAASGGGEESAEAAPQFDPNNHFIHVISYGETLGIIAQRYGFTIAELADYNGITDVDNIQFNQEIKIPIR